MPYELKEEDVAKSRSPAELFNWMEERCRQLGSTPEAKAYARSGSRLTKKFYDEVRPLALFGFREFGQTPGTLVTPSLDNDNFDGTVQIQGGRRVLVEVTCAKDGYDDSLRLEVLAKEGNVNGLAPISVKGTRSSVDRVVTIPNEMVDHDEIVDKHIAYVAQRLVSKADVIYGREHILLVEVDDYIPFRSEDDVERLKSFARRALAKLRLDFPRIVFQGSSGGLFFDYLGPFGNRRVL